MGGNLAGQPALGFALNRMFCVMPLAQFNRCLTSELPGSLIRWFPQVAATTDGGATSAILTK